MTELTRHLPVLRQLIAEGKPFQALEQIEAMLKDGDYAELHELRIQILSAELEDGHAISESLQWLKVHAAPADVAPVVVALTKRITRQVETLLTQLDDSTARLPFVEIDDLTPLAADYPAVYVLRAMLNLRIARIQRRDTPGYSAALMKALRDEMQVYEDKCLDYSRPVEPSFSLDRAAADGKSALEAALRYLPKDRLYAISLKLMGEWHELQGDYEAALDYYQSARLMKLAVGEQIAAIKLKVVQRMVARWLKQFDNYLLAGDFDQTDQLLSAASVFDRLADIHIRRGDMALVGGEPAAAQAYYLKALDARLADQEQLIQEIDPASLVVLRDMLHTLEDRPDPAAGDCERLNLARTFAPEDTRRRALAGLIASYQMSGEAAKAADLLRQLLTDRELPAAAYPHLIALGDRNEALTRQEQANDLRRQINAYREANRWPEALAALYSLCSLPNALPEDSAWLAAAVVRAGGSIQALLHVLDGLPPAHLSHLPRDLMLDILDRLCGENCWEVANRCVSALKVPKAWAKQYRARLDAYIQSQMERLHSLVEARRFDEVEALAMELLPLTPAKAGIQLLLAKACIGRGKLVEAGHLLTGLSSEADLHAEVAVAWAEIDFQRGYLDEARRRLEQITESHNPALAATRKALQNRISRLPAVLVEHADSRVAMDSLLRVEVETWSAVFGVAITSVRAGQNPPSTLDDCSQFLMALAQASVPGMSARYAWRYISERGRLRLTLLCRVEAESAEAANAGASSLWFTLRNILPLQNTTFAYEPITSQGELRRILQPFEVRWAAEIARKETTVLNQDGQEVYLVYPFNYSKTDLRRTLQIMSESPEPTALDIRFAPTSVSSWERRAIEEMIGQEHASLIQEVLPGLMESDKLDRHTPDFRQQWVTNFYPEFLARTRSVAFVAQVQMTSQAELDSSVLSMAGMDLFGTSDFEILRAFSEAELNTAIRNMTEVTLERWIYTAAPDSVPRWRHLLTPDEALAATRLPAPDTNGLPGMPSLKVRMLPMPESFARDGILLGESAFPVNGRMVKVRATVDDRLKHTYIVGRTGSGKSTLIQNMALQDIEAGRGVGVIDPHGDLIEAILERIPPHRAADVVIFDPSDQERPVALNILDVEGAFERNMVIADFLGLLQNMFDPNYQGFVGPRFENIVRQSMLALMEVVPGATLIDVVRMLTDKDYRENIVKDVRDPLVLNYWNNVGKQLDSFGWGSAKGEMIDWITAKFGRFVDDNMMRYIIGQSHNTIDFEAIMNHRQILLVDLSKGKIGPQNSKFLGLLLVPRLLIAAHRRALLKPDERDPFCLYVDEFQNFTTSSFVEMLSEARKYGVALTMANQFTSQLEPAIREAVFGNVGSLMVFQVGLKDASALSPELYPVNVDDIINLPNHYLFAKMLVNKQVIPPFAVHTLADTRPPNPDLAANIRHMSRLRYGRDMALVQAEIEQRFKR